MSDDTITARTLVNLTAKLDGLDLTGDERSMLDAILDRAAEADDEVEGFGVVFEVETTVIAEDSGMKLLGDTVDPASVTRVARASGLDPALLANVWTDMRP